MLTWSIWPSCPQLSPSSFSRARLARPIQDTKTQRVAIAVSVTRETVEVNIFNEHYNGKYVFVFQITAGHHQSGSLSRQLYNTCGCVGM